MSAPVRVETKALGDPRIEYLGKLAGYDRHAALGRLIQLWAYCTERLAHVVSPGAVEAIMGTPADTLVRAELAEYVAEGVRIKGTKGRIEWLTQQKAYASTGGQASAKRRLEKTQPGVNRASTVGQLGLNAPSTDPNPLTLTLPLPISRSESPQTPQGVRSRGRPKNPKPTDPNPAELESVARVLGKIAERTGITYRGSKEHTRLIVARMRDGASEMDLRAVIAYCANELGWLDKPDMAPFLRPETLFGPKTIEKYLDAARTWHAQIVADEQRRAEPTPQRDASFDEPEWMQ